MLPKQFQAVGIKSPEKEISESGRGIKEMGREEVLEWRIVLKPYICCSPLLYCACLSPCQLSI